jgi:hypothetical protein
MKNSGLVGEALATTVNGEVTLAFAEGLETVSGKSSEPVPHAAFAGFSAVGAGYTLLDAVHEMVSAGVVG